MNIYVVIDKWDLDKNAINLKKYSRTNLSLLASDISHLYKDNIVFSFGRSHLSIYDAIKNIEQPQYLPNLALPLLISKQIWLPDPLYSMLSIETKPIWHRLPEGGANNYSNTPLITSG